MEVGSAGRSTGVTGRGVPGRVVGVKVTQDEGIILGAEEGFKVWVEIRWA